MRKMRRTYFIHCIFCYALEQYDCFLKYVIQFQAFKNFIDGRGGVGGRYRNFQMTPAVIKETFTISLLVVKNQREK